MCFITIIGQRESIRSKYWAQGTWYLWERKFRKFWNRFWFILCLYRICILLRRICCECSHRVGKLVYPRPRLSKLVPAFTSTADIWKPAAQTPQIIFNFLISSYQLENQQKVLKHISKVFSSFSEFMFIILRPLYVVRMWARI